MALYLSCSNTLDCRVYWFGNEDCDNGNCNSPQSGTITNNRLSDMGLNGKTMGQEWKLLCDAYPHFSNAEEVSTAAPTAKQKKRYKKSKK